MHESAGTFPKGLPEEKNCLKIRWNALNRLISEERLFFLINYTKYSLQKLFLSLGYFRAEQTTCPDCSNCPSCHCRMAIFVALITTFTRHKKTSKIKCKKFEKISKKIWTFIFSSLFEFEPYGLYNHVKSGFWRCKLLNWNKVNL